MFAVLPIVCEAMYKTFDINSVVFCTIQMLFYSYSKTDIDFYCRKRLVNSMISKTSCADKVNELKNAEEEIERIRKKIQMKEGNTS